jgi:predicted DsbA family dithiol-disulfide isomerase
MDRTRLLLSLALSGVLAAAPLTSAGAKKAGVAPDGASRTAAATVGDTAVTAERLEELTRDQLLRVRSEEYQVKRRALDAEIERLLLDQEASARKLTLDSLLKAEVEAKARPVSDEEARAVYEASKDRFQGTPESQAVAQLADGMRRQRTQQRRAEFARELRAQRGVRVHLEPPRVDISVAGGPSKGAADAPITLVEYSDFQCPYCARVTPTLERLRERYGDQLRLVFRDFPLPMHKDASKAHEAAACAGDQERFWELHDKLFANQRSLQVADLKRYAADAGLSADAFAQCLDSGRKADGLRQAVAEGARFGVSGTPTFFVNGRMLSGALSVDTFAEVIDDELDRARSRTASGAGDGKHGGTTGSTAKR